MTKYKSCVYLCVSSNFKRHSNMGNYKDLEYEFVERTLNLISQYEHLKYDFEFNEQYDHTLLINCLLGLVVMPKERTRSDIPKQRLTEAFRREIGLSNSVINKRITDLRELILALRNSIAHFDIQVESYNDEFLIDEIVFNDAMVDEYYEVIRFKSDELLPFLRYYGTWLLHNYKQHGR
jgi:HEPN pEK499 p136